MSAQHTPGPWLHLHRKGSDGMYRTEVFSEEHGVIATCNWVPKHLGNGITVTYREANARLIAAAPEMLAALQAVLAEIDEPDRPHSTDSWLPSHLVHQVRAAIAKVEGGAA